MNHKIFISTAAALLCAVFICAESAAQPTWTSLNGPWRASNAKDITQGYTGSTRVLYVADNGSRFVKSTDGGGRWVTTGITPGDQIPNPLITACDPFEANRVFVGLFDGTTGRVRRSLDGGGSWISPNPIIVSGLQPRQFGISSAEPRNIFLGTANNQNFSSLWKSYDRGATWVQDEYFRDIAHTHILAIAWHPTDPNKVWVAGSAVEVRAASEEAPEVEDTYFDQQTESYETLAKGVWFSSNAGQTWERKADGLGTNNISAIGWTGYGENIFAGTAQVGSSGGGRLYVSLNFGDDWYEKPAYYEGASSVTFIAAVPNIYGRIYVGNNKFGLAYSFDNFGTSLHRTRDELEPIFDWDVRSIAVHPNDPQNAFVATSSSLFKGGSATAGQ